MMTTYQTSNTAKYRYLRHGLLLAQGIAQLRGLVANLRVNLVNGQHLLSRWGNLFDATPLFVDDSPFAGAADVAAAPIGNEPIGDPSSWSPSIRRRQGVIQT